MTIDDQLTTLHDTLDDLEHSLDTLTQQRLVLLGRIEAFTALVQAGHGALSLEGAVKGEDDAAAPAATDADA